MTTIWSRIRLELARSPGFPAGSARHGYVLVLPLDAAGKIDEATRRKAPELCTIHRFWEGEGDTAGQLVRAGQRWAFSYSDGREDDEPVPHLAEHVFRVGEYLAVREAGGAEHTCRIVAVEPAPGIAHAEPR